METIDSLQVMIDTVRFRADFLHPDFAPHIKRSLETLTKTKDDITLYSFTTGSLSGSYDSRISIAIKDRESVYDEHLKRPVMQECPEYMVIELSLHKFIMGHNLFGFNDDLSQIHSVYDYLEVVVFGSRFINRETVRLQRIDLAEIYKYDNKQQVLNVFHGLKNQKRYKTKPSTYKNNGIYFPGVSTTLKIYDKHDEFKAHDFKRLKKIDLNWANELYEQSKNSVRIECEIHHRKLNDIYGKIVYMEALIMSKIIDLKQVYLKEKQRLIFEAKDDIALKTTRDVQEFLIQQLGIRKASPLYGFWSSMTFQGQAHTQAIYPKASYYRNKKILTDLGVSFYEYGFTSAENNIPELVTNVTFKE